MKNYRKCVSVLLYLLLLLACISLVAYIYFKDKVLVVTVLDNQTHQAIQQAIVEVSNAPVTEAAGMNNLDTDSGTVEIELVDNSLWIIPEIQLQARALGYSSGAASAFVPWWQKRQEIVITLEPTRINGRITDASTGVPLPGYIYITGNQTISEQKKVIEINNEGYFEAFRLEPPVTLQVKSMGYKSWQTQLDADQLYTGSSQLDITLVSQDVMGQVTDAWTGKPVPAIIFLTDSRPAEGSRQITTDEKGHFEGTHLEPPVTVRVEAPGYEAWQTKLATLEPVLENSDYNLEVSLVPRITSGVLRAADTNGPLPGRTLVASSGDNQQIVTTDASGHFEFHRLLPGDQITIQSSNDYLPAEFILDNNEVDLSLTLQPRQVVVIVEDGFTGSRATEVNVSFDQILTTTTNSQGQAIFSRIPTSGQIVITQVGYQPIQVDYQGTDSLAVVMPPAALRGIVRGGDTGQPLPRATLQLNDTILRTDDEGRFVVNLPPTPEPLVVKSAGYHRAYAQLSQTGVFTDGVPPFSGGEGRWLVTAPCAETPAQPGPPCLEFILEPFQVKAIYIPFHYLRSREAILRYLDFIQVTELNAIVVDVKGDFGFIGWESQVGLVDTVGADAWRTDTWMPLDELISEAKKRNIYTIARFVVFKDDPLAHGKPELAAVRGDGTVWIDGEELGWANPFREEVWDYNIALAEEVAAFGFDELNFDYIRFPSDGNVGAIVYEEENTLETRTAAVRGFMQRLTDALRPYGIFVSADVFGLTVWVKPESDMNIGQRVIDVAPYVDYLAPMVYPSTFGAGNLGYDNPSAEPYGVVYRSQHQAEERVPPYIKVRPWLQGYWYSLDEMRKLKQAAIDAKSTGWSWWNAGGKYDSNLFEPAQEE